MLPCLQMPYSQEIETARRIANLSAELALRHQKTGITAENKSDDSPVTIADKECEKLIAKMLLEAFPDDGILGEEGSRKESQNGRRWIIDPIDGTRDFVRGNPLWSVLIALERGRGAGWGGAFAFDGKYLLGRARRGVLPERCAAESVENRSAAERGDLLKQP